MDDEQLLKLFHGGDAQACDELLERYKNTVLSVVHKFYLYCGDAEDLVQEGMCGLYSAMTSFSGESGFSAYAYTCIKNRILDAIKRANSNKRFAGDYSVDEETVEGSGLSPEELLIKSESKGEFNEFLKCRLSPLEYKAFSMYFDGATMTEISASLNKTYKQIDNAIARAKQKLRKSKQKK